MFSPLFFVLMSGVQQKSSVPCPISQAKGTKPLILSSAVPPGFHPCTDAGRLSERRNGAWPFCTTAVSHRPLRSELQHRYTRKPSQPVKLLSLLRCARLLSPSLRLEYSGRGHQITMNHLTTFRAGLQAARADFGEYPLFSCVLLGDFFAGRGRPSPSPLVTPLPWGEALAYRSGPRGTSKVYSIRKQ